MDTSRGTDAWNGLRPVPEESWDGPAIPFDLSNIEVTEDGVALAFTATHGFAWRFDHNAGRWYTFTGDHWREDDTARAYAFCRELARKASGTAKPKDRATARRASFASGVERFARTDPIHAVTQEVWDRDPMLLGAPGVTIDLRTGEARAPRPEDGITRRVAVAPDDHESCSLWHQFLEDATGGDGDLQSFLAQWVGYCLTGDTREHSLVFVHGDGGNGKSVFLSTVQGILGTYAQTAAMQTFVKTSADRHPTDLAALRGARMVTASETEQGRSWDESRIKVLTGGDMIAARFMRQDFFQYRPQFKLTILGNHRPTLTNVDAAVKRRFCMVPFTRKPAAPDPQLEVKLRAEWPGILRWAINGCLEWQRHGLVRPASVLDATAQYFEEQDTFGQWVAEDCHLQPRDPNTYDTAKALFEAWTAYARAGGHQPGTTQRFGEAMARLGLRRDFQWVGGKSVRVWRGIQLRRLTDGAGQP